MNSVQASESNYGRVSDEAVDASAHELLLRRNIKKAVADLTSKSPQAILLRDALDPSLQIRHSQGLVSFQLPKVELVRVASANQDADMKPAARSSSVAPPSSASGSAMPDSKAENKKSNGKLASEPKAVQPRPARQRFSTPEKPQPRASLNSKLTVHRDPPASKLKIQGTIFDKNLYTIAEDNSLKPSAAASWIDEARVDSSAFFLPKKTDSQPVLPSTRPLLARDQSITDSNRSLSRDRKAFDSRQTDRREHLQAKTKDLKLNPKPELASKEAIPAKRNITVSGLPLGSPQPEPPVKQNGKSLTLKQALKKQQELKEQIMKNLPEKQRPAGDQNQRARSSYYVSRFPQTAEADTPKDFASMRKSHLQSAQPEFQIKSFKLKLPRSTTPTAKLRGTKPTELPQARPKEPQASLPSESSQLLNDKYYLGQKKPERESAATLSKESTRSQFVRPGSAQVVLGKKPKPDAQAEAGQRQDRPRKYCLEHATTNLLYGLFMRSKPQAAQTRHNVAEGNNGRLVEGLLRQKPGTTHENSHQKANIQWSQTLHAKIAASPLKFVPRIYLKELQTKEDFEGLDVQDADALAQAVADRHLFRVASARLLKDAFQGLIKAGQTGFMAAEGLNICNHLKGISCIAHKTKLTLTIMRYAKMIKMDPSSIIPKTFLLKIINFERDFDKFVADKKKDDGFKVPVIIKPGENSNRGNGISMAYSAEEAAATALQILRDRKNTSCAIVQYYITNPLLYQRRKFDIRCYGLVVRFSSRLFFYWYLDGYARTSSFEFSLANKHNLMVHLTNEAVQVKGTLASRRPVQLREPRAREQSLLRPAGRLLRSHASLQREESRLEPRHRTRVQGSSGSGRTRRCSPSRRRPLRSRETRRSSASSCSASTS
jgi:hypothetical protein